MTATVTDQTCRPRTLWPEGAWACFSNDGKQIFFTGNLKEPDYNRLMCLDLDTRNVRTLTPEGLNARRATHLIDGRIAFNHNQDSIWTYDPKSGTCEPFISDLPAHLPPLLNPCSYPKELAVVVVGVTRIVGRRADILYKLTPGGNPPYAALTTFPPVCAGRPAVHPDGRTVVFAGNAGRFAQAQNQLWLVTPGTPPHRVEPGPLDLTQGRSPRFSPDGRWISFCSTRPESEPNEDSTTAVWIISTDGSRAYRMTDKNLNPFFSSWSPDQKQLICGGFTHPMFLLDLPKRFHAKS